jgi:hypothetical protein
MYWPVAINAEVAEKAVSDSMSSVYILAWNVDFVGDALELESWERPRDKAKASNNRGQERGSFVILT